MDTQRLLLPFFFYLAAGTFLVLGWLRPPALGRRYFHFQGFIAVALAFLSLLSSSPETSLVVQWGLVAFAVSASVALLTMRRLPVLSALAFFGSWVATLIVIYVDLRGEFPLITTSLVPLSSYLANALLSVGLLGATLAILFLTHWLSPERRSHCKELKRLVLLFIGLVVARLVFSATTLASLIHSQDAWDSYRLLLSQSPGFFLIMRWSWGILAPLLLTYLIWRFAQSYLRENETPRQGGTRGLLYILTLFVLTGETLGLYLVFFHHLVA